MIKIDNKNQITTDENPELDCYGNCPICKKAGYKIFIGFTPCFAGNRVTDSVSMYKCPNCNGIFTFLKKAS
jgi:hypothetical protein